MSVDQDERLQTELTLLDAMYPGQIESDMKAREVKYCSDSRSFKLRLPDGYLMEQLPEVLSANIGRLDVRDQLKQQVQLCNTGEEVLDSVISAFSELSDQNLAHGNPNTLANGTSNSASTEDSRKATVIVWLHHLLNTNKRKQALSPPSDGVSGITKPGYPGVLIYSGSAGAVHEHVNDLKQLNWQAFQIRCESEDQWSFEHGKGVKEVETMKEVVAEVSQENKALLMEALRMK